MYTPFELSKQFPLIAIIRGVTPATCLDVAEVLISQGFTMIEVPLNSPDALISIQKLVDKYGDKYLIGAGTVTSAQLAYEVIQTGAKLIVTPNVNSKVIQMGVSAGCAVFPGVVTPTEAFDALRYGATGLKIFPVNALGHAGLSALMSVLPENTLCYPVGGIEPNSNSMRPYIKLGVSGFGLGSSLYKPAMELEEIKKNAEAFISNFKHLKGEYDSGLVN
ncbi:2-dehydro-3-deoxy-6-phosphogalactonate aldolase [Shewanella sp. 5_MG-2023]|uniref:2-dehydro-3-deoxy-6-phosphogalactonate aldolase n=1 Tax=unclassified Shewanella TaxID=196818 RepID=UPI000C827FFC|nr:MULTISPECIES: 2-dehydro-3-deoxy-6-phosphogalactonate aldolase [unclassified Shewanella]MDO6641877.1 2-dehydro-3-deoxy-6-phosphogalactonate aldolase [Shewanella sp. 5_MG-2023]PMH99859.1 2-dehydro-3-deoxy-6-phosphogalactonate aldolase [Shewanella sp. 10N.286.48.A6]